MDDEHDHDGGITVLVSLLKGTVSRDFLHQFYVMNQFPDNRFVASDDDTGEIRCTYPTGSSLSHPDPHGS